MTLWEKHRPAHPMDIVLAPAVRAECERLSASLGGRALWIQGPSGIGKTSLARVLAASIASPFAIDEMDAGDLTNERLKTIRETQWLAGLGDKPGRAYIINEAHGLRGEAVRRLLTLLEPIPPHVLWCFTTTDDGAEKFDGVDARPLTSRCRKIRLERMLIVGALAERAKKVARMEGLDGKPLEAYVALVRRCSCNMRDVLNEVEAGAMLASEKRPNGAHGRKVLHAEGEGEAVGRGGPGGRRARAPRPGPQGA